MTENKTGALTTGRLQVADTVAFDAAYTPADLILLAASVEEHHFHPLAQAVLEPAWSARAGRSFTSASVANSTACWP